MSELVFDRVTVTFGSGPAALTAVDDVSLHVPAGSTVGLVGESGSGKSTLSSVAVGLVTPQHGCVRVGGSVIAGHDPDPDHPAGRPAAAGAGHRAGGWAFGPSRRAARRRRPVQMVFQDPYSSLDPRMTVGDSIAEGTTALGRRTSTAERAAKVAELLDLVHLDVSVAAVRPAELSGGMRQRAALARALAAEPEVVIADEITSALDVSVQATVLNLLVELQHRLGLTVLFVSHNLAVVRYVSDRIAVMRRGRLLEVGSAETLTSDPEHAYTRELLHSVPQLGKRMDLSL